MGEGSRHRFVCKQKNQTTILNMKTEVAPRGTPFFTQKTDHFFFFFGRGQAFNLYIQLSALTLWIFFFLNEIMEQFLRFFSFHKCALQATALASSLLRCFRPPVQYK